MTSSPEYPLNLITSGILSLPVGLGFPSHTTNSWAAFLGRASAPFLLDDIAKKRNQEICLARFNAGERVTIAGKPH